MRALASPVTAGPIRLDWVEQLFLAAEGVREDPVKFASDALRRLGRSLQVNDKALASELEQRTHLQKLSASFIKERLPTLKQLGCGFR